MPVRHSVWKQLGVFDHGPMESAEYAHRTIMRHLQPGDDIIGKTVLELGPGDSLAGFLVAKALGASQVIAVDVAEFATRDVSTYTRIAAELSARGMTCPTEFESIESMLQRCNAHYLTQGIESLRRLPDASVDFVLSTAVLEHVSREKFFSTFVELRRISKPSTIQSHIVDLKDHLSNSLNNLRFSRKTWESRLFRNSGFYTNRIRFSEMLTYFRQAGFSTSVLRKQMWPSLPIPRNKLHRDFRDLSETDLLVSGFSARLQPL